MTMSEYLDYYLNIFLYTFGNAGYFETLYILMIRMWLWVPTLYFFISQVLLPSWLISRENKYAMAQKWILLAIDVPKKEEQSIVGMEMFFNQMLGAHASINFKEEWIEGKFQLAMACEIIGLDGYIQFVIRCPKSWRDLVEASIYAQYPDAEITPVEDHLDTVPSMYPNPTHDMWGIEWTFDKDNYYPIKTYLEFEDKFNQLYVDPLAGLLEVLARLGPGEMIVFQLICKPLPVTWSKGSEKLIMKLIGREEVHKKTVLDELGGLATGVVNDTFSMILGGGILPEAHEEKKEDAFGKMWKMSPGERSVLELLEKKVGKLGYDVKMRFGYFAPKGKLNKPLAVNGMIGAIKQFNDSGRNGFKPCMKQTATKASYFFVQKRIAYRQRKIVKALKKRNNTIGMAPMKMNVEELATLFHFPGILVRAPLLRRTATLKREAPAVLPFEEISFEESKDQVLPTIPTFVDSSITPVIAPSSGHKFNFDYDSDNFEHRFAVDKKLHEQADKAKEILAAKEVAKVEDPKPVYHEPLQPEIEKSRKREIKDSSNQVNQETNKQVAKEAPLPVRTQQTIKKVVTPAFDSEKQLPKTEAHYDVKVLDMFAGSRALGQKQPNVSQISTSSKQVIKQSSNQVSQTAKQILPNKRYDENKDVPDNLPFV